MVVFTDPGSVPENWRPVSSYESLEAGSSTIIPDGGGPEISGSSWSSPDGSERRPPAGYCIHCQNGKPPRCHHCSVCKPTFNLPPLILSGVSHNGSVVPAWLFFGMESNVSIYF